MLTPETEPGFKPPKPNYLNPEELTLLIKGHCDDFETIRRLLRINYFDFPDMDTLEGLKSAKNAIGDICLGIKEIRHQNATNPYCILPVTTHH